MFDTLSERKVFIVDNSLIVMTHVNTDVMRTNVLLPYRGC